MIGAPDVDEVIRTLRLLEMIGGIGAEIGPASVRLLHRPVLVVAELGRAEQGQLDRLPILRRLALGCFEQALIDQAFVTKRRLHTIGGAAPLHLRLRSRSEEHTSELQSLMRTSYAVFCLKKKT